MCLPCGAGHHEDCTEVNEHKDGKHMCVCYWAVGQEYHNRMQREKVNSLTLSTVRVGVMSEIGKTDIRGADAASKARLRVSPNA